MKAIALKLPDEMLDESSRFADTLHVSRAEYMRIAIRVFNRKTSSRLRAKRLADLSRLVREESMAANAEFAAFERDPDA